MNAEATIQYMKEAENQKTDGIQDELFEISYLRNKTIENLARTQLYFQNKS